MTTVTAPRGGIPIGHVVVGGRRIDVETNSEYRRFFSDRLGRTGGTTGDGMTEIAVVAQEALQRAALARRPERRDDVRSGDGVSVARDAAGFVVSLDLGFVLGAVQAFARREQARFDPTDAQAVLATRVFRR